MQQLFLPLSYEPFYTRSRWFSGPYNKEATEWVDLWPAWGAIRFLWIYGDPGCGKTHLAHIWAQKIKALIYHVGSIAHLHPLDLFSESLNFVLEDLRPEHEEWLFHFYNYAVEIGGAVLWTSDLPPSQIDFDLPDLKSRLSTILAVPMRQPSDEELAILIEEQGYNRGLIISPTCSNFLLNHIERSPRSIRLWVEIIDHQTAAKKKNISIPFLKELIQKQSVGDK